MAKKKSGNAKKIGRSKRSPSAAHYKAVKRDEVNKRKKVKRKEKATAKKIKKWIKRLLAIRESEWKKRERKWNRKLNK
jgi:hypothetical protein